MISARHLLPFFFLLTLPLLAQEGSEKVLRESLQKVHDRRAEPTRGTLQMLAGLKNISFTPSQFQRALKASNLVLNDLCINLLLGHSEDVETIVKLGDTVYVYGKHPQRIESQGQTFFLAKEVTFVLRQEGETVTVTEIDGVKAREGVFKVKVRGATLVPTEDGGTDLSVHVKWLGIGSTIKDHFDPTAPSPSPGVSKVLGEMNPP